MINCRLFSLTTLIFLVCFSSISAKTLDFRENIRMLDDRHRQERNIGLEKLRMLADKYRQKRRLENNNMIKKAKQLNLPIRQKFKNGGIIELMRFKNNIPIYYSTYNLSAAKLINTATLWPEFNNGFNFNLTGDNITLGLWDGGSPCLSHKEFEGRVAYHDAGIYSGISQHATKMAGTMIAAGKFGLAKGMAYTARLDAYYWKSEEERMAEAAADGLLVSNHSYGVIAGWDQHNGQWFWYGDESISDTEDYQFGYYNETARDWDEIAYNAPYYLIITAGGNDRDDAWTGEHQYFDPDTGEQRSSSKPRDPDGGIEGYDSTPANGTAKNTLTVGGVVHNRKMSLSSGWGPTDDGRIKPDIVAGYFVNCTTTMNDSYGNSDGTSAAAAMVSGSIGLLLQHQENLYGTDDPFRSSTMKALVIHGADDSISGAPGPDYRFGWGLMDTQRSAEIMSLDAQSKSNYFYGGNLHIFELGVLEGIQTFPIQVLAAGIEPLRATLVWTDPPGVPPQPSLDPVDKMLVNDIDMRIEDQQGNVFKPYILDSHPDKCDQPATTGNNDRDNIEMIYVEDPKKGETYTIRFSHPNLMEDGGQLFSLIITGNKNYSPFPDTGQTKFYGDSKEINRPSEGQAFFGQDAHNQPRVPRSYTKLGHSGIELPADTEHIDKGGPWIMTRDNATGLVWELITKGNRGIEYTWEEALTYAEKLELGGYTDWDLPTVKELNSLVDRGVYYPAIDTNWFPNTLSSRYWSSTAYPFNHNYAWRVNFWEGWFQANLKEETYYVRAVRRQYPHTEEIYADSSRFVDNEDGTILDRMTGLIWQKNSAPGTYNWEQALAYAQYLNITK